MGSYEISVNNFHLEDENKLHYQKWSKGKLPWYTYFPVWVRDVYFLVKCKLNPEFALKYEGEQKEKHSTEYAVKSINAIQPYLEVINDAQCF